MVEGWRRPGLEDGQCLRYGLPVLAPKGLTLEKLMEKMAVDKQLGCRICGHVGPGGWTEPFLKL